ncbi:glycosyltransferase [Lachnospiraceae bacterium ZAX-1]
MNTKENCTDAVSTNAEPKIATATQAKLLENPPKDFSASRTRFWVILTVVLNAIYLGWRILYTLPLNAGIISAIAGLALIIVEFFGAIESLVHYFNMNKIENHPVPEVPHHLFPEVDVFIATYSEPADLLYKTINGCKHMDYPDKTKLHIHLCDDGRRSEIKELALKMGINYIDRTDNKHAKAGNLNHAMSVTGAPLLLTLDADMIPQHQLLMRIVPYFVDMELKNVGKSEPEKRHMGFVQSPQSFYNPDLFQFNLFSEGRIPNEQDYFYKDVQVSRNKSNSVIYGGSNTVISRAALEDIGGFYTASITEDFATGILLQKKGYICYAINEVLASGLSATDLKSLIQQRVRWARGCISTGRKMHILLSPKLSLGQKLNYWASVWYWYAPIKRFIYFMSPIIFAVFGFLVIRCTLVEVLIFWLPMYISSNITLKRLSRNIRTTKWTSIYETVLFPFMLFPIITEALGITLKKFLVTKKGAVENEKGKLWIYTIPFAVLTLLSVVGIINCIKMIFESGSFSPIVVLFWLIANSVTLWMAVFFVLGRDLFRSSERVVAKVDCTLKTANSDVLKCATIDFSETGVSLFMEKPVDIDEDEQVSLEMTSERYNACLKIQIVHVDNYNNGWKYSFRIVDACETKDDYLQLLYDRIPTLPVGLARTLSSFDDISLNISKRISKTIYQNRHYPRIDMNETLTSQTGQKVNIVNFNFKFIVLVGTNLLQDITLTLPNGTCLECVYERDLNEQRKLFALSNYAEIHTDSLKSESLIQWLIDSIEHNQTTVALAEKEIDIVSDMLGVRSLKEENA